MAVKHLTTSEFKAAVEAAPLAMVDFWAVWCGPCKMIGPMVESIGEQYEGKADEITLGEDVDAIGGATVSSRAVTEAVNRASASLQAVLSQNGGAIR